ncbi:MAG: hypothetical protein WDW36_007078 [Sanguina aurantia]
MLTSQEVQTAWQQLGRRGREPFQQSPATAKAHLGILDTPSTHILPDIQQQTATKVLTPELAVRAAELRKVPTGYRYFHQEMVLSRAASGTKFPLVAYNRTLSVQWKGLSVGEREPYMLEADRAAKLWLAERAEIDAQLQACGHKPLPHTSVGSHRTPSPSDLYLQQLPPDLAAAITSRARRPPYGYSVFLQDFADSPAVASSTKHRTTRAVCRAAARAWGALPARDKQPYLDKALQGRNLWLQERADLEARISAAGFAPYPWNSIKQRAATPAKHFVERLSPDLTAAIAAYPKQPLNHHNLFLQGFSFPVTTQPTAAVKSRRGDFISAAAAQWKATSPEQQQVYIDKAQQARQVWLEGRVDIDRQLAAGNHASFEIQRLARKPAHSYDLIQQILSSRYQQSPTEELRLLLQQLEQGKRVLAPEQHDAFRKVRKSKDLKKVKALRVAGSYVRFAKEVMPAVSASFPPRTSAHLVSKTMGKMWRDMSAAQQQPYRTAYREDATAQRAVADRLEQSMAVDVDQQPKLKPPLSIQPGIPDTAIGPYYLYIKDVF